MAEYNDLNNTWDSDCPLIEPDLKEEEEEEAVDFPEIPPIDQWWPAPAMGDEEDGYVSGEEPVEEGLGPAYTWEDEGATDDDDEKEEDTALIRKLRDLLSEAGEEGVDAVRRVSATCNRAREERRRRERAEEEARVLRERVTRLQEELDDERYGGEFNQGIIDYLLGKEE